MCRPDHFTWLPTCEAALNSINGGLVFDHQLAMDQHRELSEQIVQAGAQIHWLEPDPDLPDLCWTRDSSHMTPWGALITHLSEDIRSGEHERVKSFYKNSGHTTWREVDRGDVEGGDLHFISPDLALFGYSNVRSTREGTEQLAAWVTGQGCEVRLQQVDSKFVHLDVVFCMASEGLAVVCEDTLGPEFSEWLKDHDIRAVNLPAEDAMQLGCNLLALGNERVIVPTHCQAVREKLDAEGIEVITVDLEMFTLGGGGVHCLTQALRRDPLT